MAEKKVYGGPERREYCAQHCAVAANARNSVPRWAFISSLGTMVTVALIFAAWHVSSLDKLKIELNGKQHEHSIQTNQRLTDAHLRYSQDVERFILAVGENRVMLSRLSDDINDIKVKIAEFKTVQNLVLKKVDLTGP
jgi:hypothetical protein